MALGVIFGQDVSHAFGDVASALGKRVRLAPLESNDAGNSTRAQLAIKFIAFEFGGSIFIGH